MARAELDRVTREAAQYRTQAETLPRQNEEHALRTTLRQELATVAWSDAQAAIDAEAAIMAARGSLFDVRTGTDGRTTIVPRDPKQSPADMVRGWVASRRYLVAPLPQGSGAAGAGSSAPAGSPGVPAAWTPPGHLSFRDQLRAAEAHDRAQRASRSK
jgi:hypothetical protein